jgi:putative ABC transport system ATP-binding protein
MRLICAREICRSYGGHSGGVAALTPTSFEIATGEFVAIVGASGSGKSTLMNLLGLLDRPSGGTLWIDGHDCARMTPDQLARLRNQRIGFVFQSYLLLPRLNAWRNVELPLVYAGVARHARRERAVEALGMVGLGAKADRRPSELSGGEQQRVAIARAIVSDPSVILADEPTGALDTLAGRGVLDLLTGLNRMGRTIIMVTHDPSIAKEADRVLTMRDGALICDTAPSRPEVAALEVS